MEIQTIGASGTTGRALIQILRNSGSTSLIDTRIHPNSQLAGYAKQDNLEFLLELTLGIPLIYAEAFCPTADLLKRYRAKEIDWLEYETQYKDLLESRNALSTVKQVWGEKPTILCSEPTPDRCHRRLAAEYIARNTVDSKVTHLLH